MKLYFLQVENGGPIKIGYSANIPKRVKGMQIGIPWEMVTLGSCNGSLTHERRVHQLLKEYHIRGEWFHPTKEVLDTVSKIITGNFDWQSVKLNKRVRRGARSGAFRHTIAKGWLPDVARELGISKQAAHKYGKLPEHHRKAIERLKYLKPWYFKPRKGDKS